MKKTLKLKTLALSLAIAGAASVAMVPAVAQAGVSANAGLVSTYVFRGALQTTTEKPTASAGLDYEHDSGFYIGTWGSSLEDSSSLEYDLYGGWGGEFSGVSVGLGATGYYYTDSNADTYEEFNASLGYGPISIAYDNGTTGVKGGSDTWYTHKAISGTYAGFTGTYGVNEAEADKNMPYLQLDYGFEVAKGFDGTVSYIKAMDDDSTVDDKDYLILGVTKSFDIM
ncbi:TorF family putative porin [Thiomicrorhabdus sp. Milos-T2]|uniref:TorF family putative porin n=1 Tax=Thiomicrorhabdus sp. Milos-T2 TaxID=90814 RepID=UPI0004948262|nr:TorF family putative porin [Thiomicrorhabdus sp. Milos-T2]